MGRISPSPGHALGALAVAAVVLAACLVDLDRAQEGFPCDDDGTCAAGLYCDAGICVRQGEPEPEPEPEPDPPPFCVDEATSDCVCETVAHCPAAPTCARALCQDGSCGVEVVGCWTITAADPVLPADGASETWITVTGRDGDDAALPGRDVFLSTDAGALVGEVVDEGDGRYRQRLRAPVAPGTATVSWTLDGAAGAGTVTVDFVAPNVDEPTILVGGYPTPWYAGEAEAVTLRVLDAGGAAMTFTGTLVLESDAADAVLPEPITVEEATGPIRVEGIAFPSAGTFRLTARAEDDPDLSGSQTGIRITASSATLSASPDWVVPDGAAPMTVSADLRDATGAAVSGADVAFSSAASGLGFSDVTEVEGGRYEATVTSGAAGRFDVGLTVDGLPFDDRVEVCFGIACEGRFSERRRLTVSSPVDETLTDVPVLVRLNAARIDYDRARSGGEDLRFVTAAQDAFLDYEIERWDPDGESVVWLRLPSLPAGGEVTVWMYYGDPDLDAGADPAAVWADGFAAVWHFAEAPDAGADWMTDSTGHDNHARYWSGTVDRAADGPLGSAIRLDGTSNSTDWLEVPLSASLAVDAPPFTLEAWAWVDPSWPGDDQAILEKATAGSQEPLFIGIGWRGQTISCRTFTADDGLVRTDHVDAPASLQFRLGDWMYLACRYDGTEVVGFIDAAPVDDRRRPATGDPIHQASDDLFLGRRQGSRRFGGRIDEVRISTVARSDAWITVQYRSMRDELLAFGPAQSVE